MISCLKKLLEKFIKLGAKFNLYRLLEEFDQPGMVAVILSCTHSRWIVAASVITPGLLNITPWVGACKNTNFY